MILEHLREVNDALSPASRLHNQHTSVLLYKRDDRLELPGMELGVLSECVPEQLVGGFRLQVAPRPLLIPR